VHSGGGEVENRQVDRRRAIVPGELVVVNAEEAGGNVSLTTRPGDCIDDTDNVFIIEMRARDVGVVLAIAAGGMGTEYLVMTRGSYGWNMAKYFKRPW
jgi:hypothetical protein